MEEYLLQKEPRVTVASLQAVLLMMLKDIKEVCNKNDITFWLSCGSTLGAVRHEDFIPWDDDLDIGVCYQDIPAFIQALKKDLPQKYYFDCFATDEKYNVLIPAMKIRLKDTYIQEVNFLLKNRCENGGINDNNGIFIDVFAYFHVPGTFKKHFWHLLRQYALMPFLVLVDNLGINPLVLKKAYMRNIDKCDKINANSGYLGYDWIWRPIWSPLLFKKEDILPTKEVLFNKLKMPIPNNHKVYLNQVIGKNWMTLPKENKRKPKHTLKVDLGEYLDLYEKSKEKIKT